MAERGVHLPYARGHPARAARRDDVIIAGSVSNDEAKETFGDWESPKPYIRIVPQPK